MARDAAESDAGTPLGVRRGPALSEPAWGRVEGPTSLISWAARHFTAIAAVLGLVTFVVIYTIPLFDSLPIRSDGYSYYVYLPSWFIHHDLTLEGVAADCCGGTYSGFTLITRWPETGRWLNVHPIGVALLMLPFFVVAHLLTLWSNLTPDGFSAYYQYAAGLAGLTYMLAGLAILRRVLLRHFRAGVVLATLVTITFGTNLFHYGTADATFSHAFAFFTIAALLDRTEEWWRRPTVRHAIELGAIAALVVLVRHTNGLFLLLVPAYGVVHVRDVSPVVHRLWQRRQSIAVMSVTFAIVLFPQLLLYKSTTTHWLVSSYTGLGLGINFTSPHLLQVLFSTQKGLFFWTPVLLFAVAGFATPVGIAREIRTAALVALAINTYLISAFSDWQLAASYGHRGFTDSFAIFAVFLASFFEWTAARPSIRRLVAVVTTAAVALSVVQMIQYWLHIIPMWDTTWDQYVHLFLRFR
jgi:hypothetical protein